MMLSQPEEVTPGVWPRIMGYSRMGVNTLLGSTHIPHHWYFWRWFSFSDMDKRSRERVFLLTPRIESNKLDLIMIAKIDTDTAKGVENKFSNSEVSTLRVKSLISESLELPPMEQVPNKNHPPDKKSGKDSMTKHVWKKKHTQTNTWASHTETAFFPRFFSLAKPFPPRDSICLNGARTTYRKLEVSISIPWGGKPWWTQDGSVWWQANFTWGVSLGVQPKITYFFSGM